MSENEQPSAALGQDFGGVEDVMTNRISRLLEFPLKLPESRAASRRRELRDVLDDDPARLDLADDVEHFGREISLVAVAAMLAGDREGLAGDSGDEDVGASMVGSPMCDLRKVAEVWREGKLLRQNRRCHGIEFRDRDQFMGNVRALECGDVSRNATAQAQDAERHG
jgi:hypothetical protein